MVNSADPVTRWALCVLISVVMGTCLLILVAFFRRWLQVQYFRYVHNLQRHYRPIVAKLLSGVRSPSGIEALRELPLEELEILIDPLFSKRKIPERCMVFLQALCAELGLIELWQSRLVNGRPPARKSLWRGARESIHDRAGVCTAQRAKSIRNLGALRHRPSWPLLVNALDDRNSDIQLVALRSLATIGAPESFVVLCERLHEGAQVKSLSRAVEGLAVAMAGFDLHCWPALLPSLRHPNPHIRMHGVQILQTMVCREAARRPGFTFPRELLTPAAVELLLSALPVDTNQEIRARAAEVIVHLTDPRAMPTLSGLLRDDQWFVRLRTVRALAHLPQVPAPFLHREIRDCLRDPHWRVREAAIQTLITLGEEGKHQLYQHYLTFADSPARKQIVEVIERTGLIAALVEEYTGGSKRVGAHMVEQMASDAAPLGVSGILRTLDPEIRRKFLERFLPYVEAHMRFLGETHPDAERPARPQLHLEFPPQLVA